MTEFLIVLNSQSALKSFMSAGSLTIGGNLSVAVGPLGRNGEFSGSLNTKGKVAAMYSYSKTKGLFGYAAPLVWSLTSKADMTVMFAVASPLRALSFSSAKMPTE